MDEEYEEHEICSDILAFRNLLADCEEFGVVVILWKLFIDHRLAKLSLLDVEIAVVNKIWVEVLSAIARCIEDHDVRWQDKPDVESE